MKKKIKDLTLAECEKICNKHSICKGCPLKSKFGCITIFSEHEVFNFKIDMEKEIEIKLDFPRDKKGRFTKR